MNAVQLAGDQNWLATARFHEGLTPKSNDLFAELARQQTVATNKMATQTSRLAPSPTNQDAAVRQFASKDRPRKAHLDVRV